MAKKENHEVFPFNRANLAKALSNQYLGATEIPFLKKRHFEYFLSYLGEPEGLGAKTIVVEEPYVSKSYLNDYASYYSLCFEDFSKYTKRVHFFSEAFDLKGFNYAVVRPDSSIAKKVFESDCYLGHIVIKPLPSAIIGPTILKPYRDEGQRVYTTKKYHVNLYGNRISYQSLVFQEQDTVVSACATTATWTALHKAFHLFQTPIPSPSEITSSAGNLFFESGRTFPNHGLDHFQIGNVLESVGLVSELRNSEQPFPTLNAFKSFVYAYAKIGVPILLGIKISGADGGLHLVTISGFHIDTKSVIVDDHHNCGLVAHRMDKFYVHDDHIGPFARIHFEGSDGNDKNLRLETPWLKADGHEGRVADLVSVRVPLHPKIRIKYEDVFGQVRVINALMRKTLVAASEIDRVEWDVFLEFSNKYKIDLRESNIDEKIKRIILFKSLPKHIWVCRMSHGGETFFDLLYDTTSIQRGFYCCGVVFHTLNNADWFKHVMTREEFYTGIDRTWGEGYLDFLGKELKAYPAP